MTIVVFGIFFFFLQSAVEVFFRDGASPRDRSGNGPAGVPGDAEFFT